MPERLYDINEADADSKAVNLEQLTIKEEDAWWNQVPLSNLDLSSNTLTHISPKIANLQQSLTVLTVRRNPIFKLNQKWLISLSFSCTIMLWWSCRQRWASWRSSCA